MRRSRARTAERRTRSSERAASASTRSLAPGLQEPPGLSRGLLSKRLRELQRSGVIEIRPKPDGPGSLYEPTEAGRELSEVMLALQHWGSKWATLTPEHAHPGVVLWGWVTFGLDRDRLPQRRVLVRFDYPTLSGPGRRGWLLIERGDGPLAPRADRVGRRRALPCDRGSSLGRAGPGPSHLEPARRTDRAPVHLDAYDRGRRPGTQAMDLAASRER